MSLLPSSSLPEQPPHLHSDQPLSAWLQRSFTRSKVVIAAGIGALGRPSVTPLRGGRLIRWMAILALLVSMLAAAFGSALWPLIGLGILLVAFIVATLLILGVATATLVMTAIPRMHSQRRQWLQRLGRLSFIPLILIAAIVMAALGSQWHAATPPILSATGQTVPGSIATLEQFTLNGSRQWVTIRGKNRHNPVLLFLAGGPGGSELTRTRIPLAALEDHFVVVNWDQPGAGKSYNAIPIAHLTPQRYVADGHALILQLRARFHQDKIYLMGTSWGSILGIWLVQQYPTLFAAYIGSGQMVNTTENDVMGYQLALQYATEHGNAKVAATLRHNGPPPYTGSGMLLNKYTPYLNVLNDYMFAHAKGEGHYNDVAKDMLVAPEYGLVDKVNWVRGLIDTFTVVYPQLATLDFMTQATTLQVPVYFLVGRWDVNAMASLVEHYYTVLHAPHKELIWFEQSGHAPNAFEPNKTVDVIVNRVLAQNSLPVR